MKLPIAITTYQNVGALAAYLRQVVNAIVAGWRVEHHPDGTHKFDWVDVEFDASNFTGFGTMTWTVAKADQRAFRYMVIGATMWVQFDIYPTTVGGTPTQLLLINIPGGYRAKSTAGASGWQPCFAIDNGAAFEVAIVNVFPAITGNRIRIALIDSTNWAAATNATGVFGQIAIPLELA